MVRFVRKGKVAQEKKKKGREKAKKGEEARKTQGKGRADKLGVGLESGAFRKIEREEGEGKGWLPFASSMTIASLGFVVKPKRPIRYSLLTADMIINSFLNSSPSFSDVAACRTWGAS